MKSVTTGSGESPSSVSAPEEESPQTASSKPDREIPVGVRKEKPLPFSPDQTETVTRLANPTFPILETDSGSRLATDKGDRIQLNPA